jgi:hypothetical protein
MLRKSVETTSKDMIRVNEKILKRGTKSAGNFNYEANY